MSLDLRNLTPTPGELDEDPELARFTTIGAQLEVESGFVPMVYVKVGESPYMLHVVYDGVAGVFSSIFDEYSHVDIVGDTYTFAILPTGGWWASPVEFTFGQFQEAL